MSSKLRRPPSGPYERLRRALAVKEWELRKVKLRYVVGHGYELDELCPDSELEHLIARLQAGHGAAHILRSIVRDADDAQATEYVVGMIGEQMAAGARQYGAFARSIAIFLRESRL